jgi:predicted PurR-regulated permease PerM
LVTELSGDPTLPPPPEAIRRWPLIGEYVFDLWRNVSVNLKQGLIKFAPQLKPLVSYIASAAQDAFLGLLQIMIAIAISGFFFPSGRRFVGLMTGALEGVLHARGYELLHVTAATIRNVSRGVIGVALLQAALLGIGFAFAGIKAPGLFAFFALLLGILQVGPSIIIFPAIVWAWMTMETLHAVIFTSYMVPVGLVDNLLRPVLMARGLSTPVVVIVIGVIGGTLSQGLVGVFFGPVITAVAWDMLVAWIGDENIADEQRAA